MSQVLVVEDQPNLLRSIITATTEAGFVTAGAATLAEAAERLAAGTDLIILDIMLPDGSGLDWLRALRSNQNDVPVLLLTARDSIQDRVAGLDCGADDYLVKPFSIDELLVRMRALLRGCSTGFVMWRTVVRRPFWHLRCGAGQCGFWIFRSRTPKAGPFRSGCLHEVGSRFDLPFDLPKGH